ncbi:hypothetical protein FRC04_006338 [Tulasnella sp. 424]|nr:hypothetical protein FRC04_006338 [Tulasnella sp. 424]KAG8980390.1 hypothetical protein FRC05_006021 [Tulasnella sp. 425]
MGHPIKLYVYDLSNGMARNMSFQLTGKQIDGIWHTSVVVFGREVYYGPYNAGPGIQVVVPGQSHHGRPLKIEDMGETDLDEDTFWEYISEIQAEYTGDKYHLLDFNCNSFTNDCVGFLTGRSIPSWIIDLPADFLSTPFGQSMRPMIDNMFRRAVPTSATPVPATPYGSTSGIPSTSNFNPSTLTTPVQIAGSSASFNALLQSNRIVVAFFTSDTCPPCGMIAPVFKQIAEDRNRAGAAFVEVNMQHSMSGAATVAREWGIRATPTFLFFLDGVKTSELKGANAPELKTQVDLLFFEAFPPHPHTKLDLPTIRKTSLTPIIYTQPPNFDAALAKLVSFVEASPNVADKDSCKQTFRDVVVPKLKVRFPPIIGKDKPTPTTTNLDPNFLPSFAKASRDLLNALPPTELFPVIDLWRIAVLDAEVAKWLSLSGTRSDGKETDVTGLILSKVHEAQESTPSGAPRNLLLTTLRLASNCFAHTILARHILTPSTTAISPTPPRSLLTSILVPTLLHEDVPTRTAAASLAFDVAAYVQKPLMEQARNGNAISPNQTVDSQSDGDWEVEMSSALIEALRKENASEEVVHRLTASLAFIVHLSPNFSDSLGPLMEVLSAKDVLQSKLGAGGCGEKGVTKDDIRRLVKETVQLCSSA